MGESTAKRGFMYRVGGVLYARLYRVAPFLHRVFLLFIDNQYFACFKHFPGMGKTSQGVYFLFI